MPQTITLHAKITGRVQGVGFRWWTQARATALGVNGWVRNDETGSVSTLLQGDKAAVEAMVKELWGGPAAAAVRNVQTDPVEAAPRQDGFRILR